MLKIPQQATLKKSTLAIPTCESKSLFQVAEKVLEQDIIVRTLALEPRRDIGHAVRGKQRKIK